jgi:hypothetical protein
MFERLFSCDSSITMQISQCCDFFYPNITVVFIPSVFASLTDCCLHSKCQNEFILTWQCRYHVFPDFLKFEALFARKAKKIRYCMRWKHCSNLTVASYSIGKTSKSLNSFFLPLTGLDTEIFFWILTIMCSFSECPTTLQHELCPLLSVLYTNIRYTNLSLFCPLTWAVSSLVCILHEYHTTL